MIGEEKMYRVSCGSPKSWGRPGTAKSLIQHAQSEEAMIKLAALCLIRGVILTDSLST